MNMYSNIKPMFIYLIIYKIKHLYVICNMLHSVIYNTINNIDVVVC